MEDDGILFSYRNSQEYTESVQRVRQRMCTWVNPYFVLDDRRTKRMRRIAVAIFDENNDCPIDVCMLGNTLYVLGMRLAERTWFVNKNQKKEFGGINNLIDLPFESGYGALGITVDAGIPVFSINDASKYCNSIVNYIKESGSGSPSENTVKNCKIAIAYFAMTIGEAARFHEIETKFSTGVVDPAPLVPFLQRWVISSCVPDNVFPIHSIAVVGIPEVPRGDIISAVVNNAMQLSNHAPPVDAICLKSKGALAFMRQEPPFNHLDIEDWKNGYGFLLYAYYLSRCDNTALSKAHKRFDNFKAKNKPVTDIQMRTLSLD
jgi:hypothetical protein